MEAFKTHRKSPKILILVIVIVLLSCYFIFHIIQLLFPPYSVEIALIAEDQEVIEAQGVVIRDECQVTYKTNDLLYYPIEDGDHVAKNSVIAEQYKSASDISAHLEIRRMQREIEQLKNLENSFENVTVNPEQLQTKAADGVISLVNLINMRTYQGIDKERDKIIYAINERLLLYGDADTFSDHVQKLYDDVYKLKLESGERTDKLLAEESGYFVRNVDGYESMFDPETVESLTPSDLENVNFDTQELSSDVIGKIVKNNKWYIAMVVSDKDAERIQKKNDDSSFTFTSVDGENIPVELEALNFSDDNSKAAAIFSCTYMNKSLASLRSGQMRITLDTYKGLRIPKEALRTRQCTANVLNTEAGEASQVLYEKREGNYEGVYVRIGETVKWKFISKLYTGNDYIICDISPREYDPLTTPVLAHYDEVLVKGRDLEDGKLIR